MAVPSYTTDLLDWIADNDTAAWGEYTTMTAGGAPDEADTESALQGINTTSQSTNTIALFSMGRLMASPITLSAGQVFLVWHGHGVATSLLNYANGGLRLVVSGVTLGDWKAWAVGGSDVAPLPYGKWVNNPIDPTITAEFTNGTPPTGATNIYSVGSAGILSTAVFKGQPHVVDMIRYGRAEARFAGGEVGNYATFSGFATVNDYNDVTNGYNRWGLFQTTTGGYLWKGLMVLGHGALVNFVDSNKNIYVQDTRKVLSGFNRIEVRNVSSVISWLNINILATGTTSRGDFECIDDATVTMSGCTFTDMGTWIFKSNSTISDTTFRRCGLITQGSSTLTSNVITNSTSAVSVLSDNPSLITACDFRSDGSNHALEITTAGTYALTDNIFTDYATTNGTTGNEVIYNNSGGNVIINVSGGSGVVSYRNAGASTTTVNSTVAVTLTGLKDLTEVRVLAHGTATELAGVENATDGSINDRSFTFSLSAATAVDIAIHSLSYEYILVDNYIVPSLAASLPIAQRRDRNYLNPA